MVTVVERALAALDFVGLRADANRLVGTVSTSTNVTTFFNSN